MNRSALRRQDLAPSYADRATEWRWAAAEALSHGQPERAQALTELAAECEHHDHAIRVAPDRDAPAIVEHADLIERMADRIEERTAELVAIVDALARLATRPTFSALRAERAAAATVSHFSVTERSTTENCDTAPTCGLVRWGRRRGRRMAYRVLCGARGCVHCAPWVAKRQADAIPDNVELHAVEIDRAQWRTFAKRLERSRSTGGPGDYVRVPMSDGRLLVVTDADVGTAITTAQVRAVILDKSTTADGNLSASKGWRAKPTEAPDDFADEGIVTSSMEWITANAKRFLGVDVYHDERRQRLTFGALTDEQDARLTRIAGVVTDADYWAEQLRAGRGRPSGRILALRLRGAA